MEVEHTLLHWWPDLHRPPGLDIEHTQPIQPIQPYNDLDDPEADLWSESQDSPEGVASPPGQFSLENGIAFVRGLAEASAPPGLTPGGDCPFFIPTPEWVETSESRYLATGYWQRHACKTSVKKPIRSFFLTGQCKWGGRIIRTYQELAQVFDSQVVEDVRRKLHKRRGWWEQRSRHSTPEVPSPRGFRRRKHNLDILSFNIKYAGAGRLEAILDKYSKTDIICLQGTGITKKRAPYQGRIRCDTHTPLRQE